MREETWKPVVGWEEFYEVSDHGRVRSLPRAGATRFGTRTYGGNIINPGVKKSGYLYVNLTKQGVRQQKHVHVMVLEAFVGPRPICKQGCHNDGDPANARLENLRWDTAAGNHADKRRHGTAQIGERNPNAKLTAAAVTAIRTSAMSAASAAKAFGVTPECIKAIRNGETWSHLA